MQESPQPFDQPTLPGSQPFFPPPGALPPQKPGLRQRFGRLPLLGKLGIGCGVPLLVLCACLGGLAAWGSTLPKPASTPTSVAQAPTQPQPTTRPTSASQPSPTAAPSPTVIVSPTPTATPSPTATPTPTPTPTPIYPPTSLADLHALAAKGDASAIHEFDSETVGLASCPQPKREVTVSPGITGQQLAEDLLAYFYAQGLDNPCGSVVFAYHSQSEAGDLYTAGRILVNTSNTDPNNNNAQRTLTLDVGDALSATDYNVTYS